MPTGPALITKAELASALQIAEGSLVEPTSTWLLALASDVVRDELDQRIDYVDDDVAVLLGSGTPVLLLPELPVLSVSSVKILAEGSDTLETLTLSGASIDCRLEAGPDGRVGILRRLNGVWPRRRLIEVTYEHGYRLFDDPDPSEVPGSIRLAVARAAARGYFTTDGIRQETVGRYSVTYAAESGVVLTDFDKSGLARYYKGTRAGAR